MYPLLRIWYLINNMKKICVITGTRAEYGLLKNLLTGLKASTELQLQLVVTGSHLVATHGNTKNEILCDNFNIDAEIDMLLASDSPRAVGQSLGLGVIGLTNALGRLSPDLVLLLGDRFEALAAAQSAMILRIPIAHIHGGEATEGLVDEAIRHSITKMAHVHFTSAEPYRRKVIQMGEQPKMVYNFGALGLDNIASLTPISRTDLEENLGLALTSPILLVTYHPLTLEYNGAKAVDNLLDALAEEKDAVIVFTGANADALGQEINSKFVKFCAERNGKAVHVFSLGVQRYLSLMQISETVIGNSSSGLLEAPYLGVPTVNIGDRQRGRLTAPAVINCGETKNEICAAIRTARSDTHRHIAAQKETPYGCPGASKKIIEVLESLQLDGILYKRFFKI